MLCRSLVFAAILAAAGLLSSAQLARQSPPVWIGVGFIFRGVATSISAISDPALPGRGWSIFLGVISLLAGIVVLASPFESIGILAIVVGAWFVVIGVFEIVSSFGIRKASKTLDN